MLFVLFLIFVLIGLFLNLVRNYDLFTISAIYLVFSIFLYFIDVYAVLYVILFFFVAESITLILNKKHEHRNYKNIIGNCLASIIIFAAGYLFSGSIGMLAFNVGALAAISAAFSDTLSSEIGLLSKRPPVLITTFKKVKKGIDGGITILGLTAAFTGTLITALFFWLAKYPNKIVIIIALSGIVGSIIDSIIGALIERKGHFNNNQTNFSATFLTGLIAIVVFLLI